MNKLYYSYNDLVSDCRIIAREMAHESYKPDVIIGPGRGAYPFGVMLSHYFEVPFEAFRWQTRDGKIEDSETLKHILSKYTSKNILVVDDINDTGATFKWLWDNWNLSEKEHSVKFATLTENTPSVFGQVSYCVHEVNKTEEDVWLVYPWENVGDYDV